MERLCVRVCVKEGEGGRRVEGRDARAEGEFRGANAANCFYRLKYICA